MKRYHLSPLTSLLMSLSLVVGILVCDVAGSRLITAAHAQTGCADQGGNLSITQGVLTGGVVVRDVMVDGQLVALAYIPGAVQVADDTIVGADGIIVSDGNPSPSGIIVSDGSPVSANGIIVSDGSPCVSTDGIIVSDGSPATNGIIVSDGSPASPNGIIVSDGGGLTVSGIIVSDGGGVTATGGTLSGDGVRVENGIITGENLRLTGSTLSGGLMSFSGSVTSFTTTDPFGN